MNVVCRETAEKITTNRDSRKKHIDIHLMRNRQIVIEGCEDHKYCYWLSKEKLDDIETNADILALTMYEQYDYVAYSVYLYPKLFISQTKVLEGITISIDKVTDEPGIRFRAPWGCDSNTVSKEENGLYMAHELVKYYDDILAKCATMETDTTLLQHFEEIEKFILKNEGRTTHDYSEARKLIEPMWKWEFVKLSPNDDFRDRYMRLRSWLDKIYNSHMSRVR